MVHCLMLDLISAYENYLTKVKQASANTVFSYLRDVRQFAAWLQEQEGTNVVDATQLHISGYLSYLEQLCHNLSIVFVELNNSLDSFADNIKRDILIRRVNRIRLQSKSH